MRRSSYVNYYVLCLVCWILLGITGKPHSRRDRAATLLPRRGSTKQMAASRCQISGLRQEDALLSEGDTVNSGYPTHARYIDRRVVRSSCRHHHIVCGEAGLRGTRATDGSIRFWGVAVRCIRLPRAPHALTYLHTYRALVRVSPVVANTGGYASVVMVREGEDRGYARIDKD